MTSRTSTCPSTARRSCSRCAARSQMDQDEEDPPTWEIWEYDILQRQPASSDPSDTVAAEGNDVSPHYLPDGRIVFSSTRQRTSKAILLDENKPQFEAQTDDRSESAFVLHVMNGDGSNIHQISFNQSSDRDATVDSTGRIVFSRWDRAPGGKTGIHLYSANPDGTDLQLLYGVNSHNTGTDPQQPVQFVHPREMQNGRIPHARSGRTRIRTSAVISSSSTRRHTLRTPSRRWQTPAWQVLRRRAPRRTTCARSKGPPWRSFQLRLPLLGWHEPHPDVVVTVPPARHDRDAQRRSCPARRARLANPDAEIAPPLYSVWMFDPGQNTLLPILTPTEEVDDHGCSRRAAARCLR